MSLTPASLRAPLAAIVVYLAPGVPNPEGDAEHTTLPFTPPPNTDPNSVLLLTFPLGSPPTVTTHIPCCSPRRGLSDGTAERVRSIYVPPKISVSIYTHPSCDPSHLLTDLEGPVLYPIDPMYGATRVKCLSVARVVDAATPPPRPVAHPRAGITVYAHPHFGGKPTQLPQGSFTVTLEAHRDFSIRLTPGLQVVFYPDAHCSGGGASIALAFSSPSLRTFPLAGFGPVRCMRISPLTNGGVVLFSNPRYTSSSPSPPQTLTVGTTPAHALGFQPIRSVDVGPGYRITAYMGHSPNPVSLDASSPSLLWNNILRLVVSPVCQDDCNGGECIGPGQCSCPLGRRGRACQFHIVDDTSSVTCQAFDFRREASLLCSITLAFRGVPVPHSANVLVGNHSPFTVAATTTAVSVTPVDDTWRSWVLRLDPRAPFPSRPLPFFSVSLRAPPAHLPVPSLAVLGTPDATSYVSCTRVSDVVVGSSTSCTIFPQANGAPVPSRVSDVSLSIPGGCLVPSRIVPTPKARMPNRVDVATQFDVRLRAAAPARRGGSGPCSWSLLVHRPKGTAADVIAVELDPITVRVPDSMDFLGLAEAALYSGRVAEAEKHIRDAVNVPETAREARVLHARVLVLLGKFQKAVDVYTSVMKGAPKEVRKTLRRGAYGAKKLAESGVRAKKAIAAGSALPEGKKRVLRYTRALEQLHGVVDAAKASPEWRLLRATAGLELGNYALVRHDASQARSFGHSSPAHHGRAIFLLAEGLLSVLGHHSGARSTYSACANSKYGTGTASLCMARRHLMDAVSRVLSSGVDPILSCLSPPLDSTTHGGDAGGDKEGCCLEAPEVMVWVGNALSEMCTHGRTRVPDLTKRARLCQAAIGFDVQVSQRRRRRGLESDRAEDADGLPLRAAMWVIAGRALLDAGDLEGATRAVREASALASMAKKVSDLASAVRFAREEKEAAEEAARPDFYELLGVARDATTDEIKRAYRLKAREYHPDRNSAPDAAATFILIAEAMAVLSDPELRARYDAGHDVSSQSTQSRSGFKFHFDKEAMRNRKPGEKVKAWFVNDEGEVEWTELDPDATRDSERSSRSDGRDGGAEKDPPAKHCCIPES